MILVSGNQKSTRLVRGFAIIRFLPAIEGEQSPYVKTFNHGWKYGAKWFIENCPTTIGKECPICEANSVLWNTESKENQEIARKRKRKIIYISNIIVLSDAKRPQNEGKVFLYKYGTKIFAKLMNAIKPEFEDEVSFDPFNFWEGAPFKLKIRNVEGFRNYDKSEFGECEPLFPEDDAMEKVWRSEYDLTEFVNPKLFKSYDELQTKFLIATKSPVTPPTARRTEEDDGDDTQQEEPVQPRKAASTKSQKPEKSEKPADPPAYDDDDDFKLFNSLIED